MNIVTLISIELIAIIIHEFAHMIALKWLNPAGCLQFGLDWTGLWVNVPDDLPLDYQLWIYLAGVIAGLLVVISLAIIFSISWIGLVLLICVYLIGCYHDLMNVFYLS
jgi:hypothetical protein